MIENQGQKVANFFDDIAQQYTQKYSSTHPILIYFFNQRLKKATQNIDFKHKKILDIGAGTGTFYDYICTQQTDFQYVACDISNQMLHHSNIPEAQRFVGQAFEIEWDSERFDLIYALGVTTYMTAADWQKTIIFLTEKIDTDGKIIFSFTNKSSLDFKIRNVIKKILPKRHSKNVLHQDFEILAFEHHTLLAELSPYFKIEKTHWLNQTISGLNRIFPKSSIAVGDYLLKKLNRFPNIMKYISSDFLLVISKK